MSRTLGIGVAMIIIAGAAYYLGTMRSGPAITENGRMTAPAGENTDMAPGEYRAVDPAMTGTWKSAEDAKFTREFRSDGTVVDRYEGEASATVSGAYVAVDPAVVEVPGVPAEFLAGVPVLKITWENDAVPMFFSIQSLTDTELSMTNLSGRGNILVFAKVN